MTSFDSIHPSSSSSSSFSFSSPCSVYPTPRKAMHAPRKRHAIVLPVFFILLFVQRSVSCAGFTSTEVPMLRTRTHSRLLRPTNHAYAFVSSPGPPDLSRYANPLFFPLFLPRRLPGPDNSYRHHENAPGILTSLLFLSPSSPSAPLRAVPVPFTTLLPLLSGLPAPPPPASRVPGVPGLEV